MHDDVLVRIKNLVFLLQLSLFLLFFNHPQQDLLKSFSIGLVEQEL